MTGSTSDKPLDICLMTVATDGYLPGCIVMISSFLACNPWFKGDIKVIVPEMADHNARKLRRLVPQADIVAPGAALVQTLARLDITQSQYARFASLDAFAASDYDRLLFCDSDMVFQGDLQNTVMRQEEFLVTPDGPKLRGNPRSHDNFKELTSPSSERQLKNTFNAGFMVIGKSMRSGADFDRILAGLTDGFTKNLGTKHTDQAILNRQLDGRQTLIGAGNNYLLSHAKDMELDAAQIKTFHFNGPRKPWDKNQQPLASDSSPIGKIALGVWQAALKQADPEPVFFGARTDMPATIKRHLFLLCPNNSGSTFLSKAIGTSAEVWSLYREGQHLLGFAAPTWRYKKALLWAATPQDIQLITNPEEFDWVQNKKSWYFQAQAKTRNAPVFFTKAPPFLAYPDVLRENFDNTRFLMMVRNPYAVVEAIFRYRSKAEPNTEKLLALAASHIIACFQMQRQNQKRFKDIGVFFTYEEMCAAPRETAEKIRALVPEISSLQLDQRLFIKNNYYERLRNMNDEQIARLTPQHLQVINRIFAPERDLLAHFGYDLMGASHG